MRKEYPANKRMVSCIILFLHINNNLLNLLVEHNEFKIYSIELIFFHVYFFPYKYGAFGSFG